MGNLRTRLSIPTPEESYNALFGETVKDGIQQLSLADLHPYPNQPFKPYTTSRLQELAEDVAQNGVLCPIIVRPMPEDGDHSYSYYQILAGHNRVAAANMAGLEKVPAIVRDVSDDEAALIMVNTNLNQRDKLLPSEKAWAYKMQLEAMKRQGNRTDLTSRQVVGKLNSAEMIGRVNSDNERQVQRYIRLTYLVPSLLDMVDDEQLAFMVGVYLSYLSEEKQLLLFNFMDANEIKKISMAQAEVMKNKKETLDGRMLQIVFFGDPNKKKPSTAAYKLPVACVEKYFPDLKPVAIEKELVRILDFYFTKGD